MIALASAPAAGAGPTPTTPTSNPTARVGTATHIVPPPAPAPTDSRNSPRAPDPHPPVGGIGPNGAPVGGALLASRGLVVPAGAPALPKSLTAQAWILVDFDSGQVLAGQDVHGRYQPASILKTLTVDTVLPDLPGSESVTVSATAANTEGSHAGLLAGGSYTVDDLFSGLLLVSGNDAAMALAEAYGGVDKTVAAMNKEALALGAYDTYVQTPSGLDGWQQLTSAYDMALFLRAALTQPRFVAYDQQPTATLPAQHVGTTAIDPVKLVNQNARWFSTVPGALVAKTGYTDAASHTALFATERNGRRLGVVFMRAQRWPLDQWQQAAALLDWGYALPASTTAVGELAAPVPSASPAKPKTSAAATHTARTTAATTHDRSASIGVGGAIALIVLVIGAAVGSAEVRHRRRRTS